MGSWSGPGETCECLCPGCSRVCPIQTAAGTGGPGPGLWHPAVPWMMPSPRSQARHSWGRASSCCPLQPAPTLQSEIQFRETERELLNKLNPSHREPDSQHITEENLQSSPHVSPYPAWREANLLPLRSVEQPCISSHITDLPSSMWHGCWCIHTALLMTSAPHLPASLPNN